MQSFMIKSVKVQFFVFMISRTKNMYANDVSVYFKNSIIIFFYQLNF